MTTENFTENRNQIILTALEIMGIHGIGKTASNEDIQLASNLLNMMLKKWQGQGYHLWTKTEGVLFLNPYQETYSLGNLNTDDRATTEDDFVMATLSSNVSNGASTITVNSTAGMLQNDQIGVVLSTNYIFWTTIASIINSTSLTLTSPITNTANAGGFVYTYTNLLTKPLRIIGMARYRTGYDNGTATANQIDIPITEISYDDYQNLPTKTSTGRCYQLHYNPKINDGTMFLFPRPITGADRIHFTYERRIDDLLNANDPLDFPDEWLEPIAYQLAVRLGPPFGKIERAKEIFPVASQMLQDILDWDGEITSLNFVMDKY